MTSIYLLGGDIIQLIPGAVFSKDEINGGINVFCG